MELRIPTKEQLRTVYDLDLKASFPPAELKSLQAIEEMTRDGYYEPWCLFDGDDIVGECFLWLGNPGWALLDYLCVSPRRRNAGLGAVLLEKMCQSHPDMVILGEAEAPEDAPDPTLARRRLEFYRRCGVRLADYDSAAFGVHYKTLYWSAEPLPDSVLMEQHRAVYLRRFSPEKYAKYLRIPLENGALPEQTPWDD